MITAADWKAETDAWFAEHEITPGMGEAPEAETVLLSPHEQLSTTTRAILVAERPAAALWQPNATEGCAAVSLLTSRGWTVLAYFDPAALKRMKREKSETAHVSETDATDTTDDSDELDEGIRALGRSLATQPIRDFISACVPPKHPTTEQLRNHVMEVVAREHPEHEATLAVYCASCHFDCLVMSLNEIRAVHQLYWLEHPEELADRVMEWKPGITSTTKKALRPIVWSYLRSVDRCANQDICDPAVEVIQERVRSGQA